MTRHRSHSISFKREFAQEVISGETQHGLAKQHDLSCNVIRLWVQKYDTGAFDEDAEAADRMQEYEARIATLERLVAGVVVDWVEDAGFQTDAVPSSANLP